MIDAAPEHPALATAKAILAVPGAAPQQLHPPAVTLGAFYAAVAGFVIAALPVIATLAGLHDPLAAVLGEPTATRVVDVAQIIGALVGARSAHVAATGRSIVSWVDAGAPSPPPTS